MEGDREHSVVLSDIRHLYPRRVALDGVSLSFKAGSSTAVVGPDGVGKSTLLGLIAGARRLQSGALQVLGGDMGQASHRNSVSHRIAYMPQGLGRNLYPSLSVTENLHFFGRLFGLGPAARRARMDRLLEATGLAAFRDRPAGKLSGGMKQKLSLCSALLHDPDLLILDEPTTGIDPLSRRQFWTLIDRLQAENSGMTVIVSTAYMEEAERFGQIVALDAGRVLIAGSPAEILAEANARSLEDAFVALRTDGERSPRRGDSTRGSILKDGPTVIEAEGLARRFGAFTAVDRVSFRIRQGEIFGFLGSNGCGKTTTMKMLTGLLAASEGTAQLLGRPVEATDLATRFRIGYMSQSFSLYEELSVRANLDLHARLYRIPAGEIDGRVAQALERFDLKAVADAKPQAIPLGQRQRLQLAVACLHRPDVLILDEPTSGVDPVARDLFWEILLDLSRREGVTIFLSTHFMNEAERCDRVSLMHAGKLLAIGTPEDIAADIGAATLEEAFIAHLERETGADRAAPEAAISAGPRLADRAGSEAARGEGQQVAGGMHRVWAFAYREALEILRDPIRVAFAFLGPLSLLITLGYGINFDVDALAFAVFDQDQSPESRSLVEDFRGSRYFLEAPLIGDRRGIDRRLRTGELDLVIVVPPGFGKDLLEDRAPEIAFFLDGSITTRATRANSYIQGIMRAYAGPAGSGAAGSVPYRLEERYRYNQEFRSAQAIVPGSIMVIMALIPAMMAALSVVREREVGSISNLYCSPARATEFIFGKLLPYVALSYLGFLALVGLSVFHFGLAIKGSAAALLLAGLLYVFSTTALGMFASCFATTQIAATIAAVVICVVPSFQFSGYLYPSASLNGFAYVAGHGFPALWFQNVSIGVFAKERGFFVFLPEFAILFGFGILFLLGARLFLRKQER